VLPNSTSIDRVDPAARRIQDQTPVSAKKQAKDHSTCETKRNKSIHEKQTAKKTTKKAGRSKATADQACAVTAPPVHVVREAPADDHEPLNIKPTWDEGVAGGWDYVRDSEPGSILSAGSSLKDVVRLAARAYSNDRFESGDSNCDGNDGEWDWLLDDHGRLVSPGRSGDTLADFTMISIVSVWDNSTKAGNSPEKTMTAIVQELQRAADILGRCVDRIDDLRYQDEDSESDKPISLREIIQASAAGYTKAGKNAWNQMIGEDGFFEAENDFEDLLAKFVIREIGLGYSSSEPRANSIDNAIAGVACAQSRLRRVATAIAWSHEMSLCD
jgi:hypothetical protein